MLFDPTLVAAVYADADTALRDEDVTSVERSWLTAIDPRRWRADPHRQARALHGLVQEFPVSAAVYRRTAPLDTLLRYFSSSDFHACIMTGDSLAVVFGGWLQKALGNAHPVGALETMICARRRQVRRGLTPGSDWALNPAIDADHFPFGTLAYYDTVLRTVSRAESSLLEYLLAGTAGETDAFQGGSDSEALVIEVTDTGGVGDASPELVNLLRRLRYGATHADVLSELSTAGMETDEALELLKTLEGEGLIVQVAGVLEPISFV